MDKNMKYVVLVAVGGVGVYLIWKGNYFQQWFPSLFGPSVPATTPTIPGTTPPVTTPKVIPPPTTPPPPGTNYPAAGTLSISNGATYSADGKGGWVLVKAAPASAPQPCPTGQVLVNALDPTSGCITPGASAPNYCDTNTPGWSMQDGQCKVIPPSVSQQMVAAAGMSDGLDMDQWCYYYSQVTGGSPCPRDPGDIIAAAGDNPPSFPQGRDTLMDIGTWLAFMNQNGAGLSGLELAALHVANAWLV